MAEHAHNTPARRSADPACAAGRRSLFGTAAAALLLAPAALLAAPVMPDAELVAMGREALPLTQEFDRLSVEWFALSKDDDAGIDRVAAAQEPLFDRLSEMLDRADRLTPTTLEGFRAKAILLRFQLCVSCTTRAGVVHEGELERMNWDFLTALQDGAGA